MKSLLEMLRETRLDGDRAPLLTDALEGLFDLVRSADLDPRVVLGAGSAAALIKRSPRLGDWLSEAALTQSPWGAAIDEASLQAWQRSHGDLCGWIDAHLTAELLLAAAGFPHVAQASDGQPSDGWRKAMAAVIALDAYRPLLDAAQEPEALRAGGSHLRPLLAVWIPAGRFLAARLGFEAVVAAAAGQAPLIDALDHGDMAEVEALLRGQHDAAAAQAAQPFDEQDAAWVEDAILAMVHRRRRQAGQLRSVQVVPAGGGLRLDLAAAEVATLAPPPSLGQHIAEGWIDPLLGRLPLPAGPCRALFDAGWQQLELRIGEVEELGEALNAVFDAFEGQVEDSVVGEGFELRALRRSAAPPAL